jgi:hypothetical protein
MTFSFSHWELMNTHGRVGGRVAELRVAVVHRCWPDTSDGPGSQHGNTTVMIVDVEAGEAVS